jgi:hypothetical protein
MPAIPPYRALAVLGFVVAIGQPSSVFETRCDASSPPASLIPEWKSKAVLLLQGGCAEPAAQLAREAYELSLGRSGGADPNTTDARSLLTLAERFVALSPRDREVAARLWRAETQLEAMLDSDSLQAIRPIADDILR